MSQSRLVLASSSRYRRELLSRLGLPFRSEAPEVDETPLPGEAPAATAARLARLKASTLAAMYAGAVVIGSDQVAALGDLRLDKPGNRQRAIDQLLAASGRTVEFHTAVCILSEGGARETTEVVPTRVTFRPLGRTMVERYVDIEQPFDCAGSAKAEGLGIALIAAIEGTDPTALIGLPLIAVTGMLPTHGLAVL